jgi:hypothetical protein
MDVGLCLLGVAVGRARRVGWSGDPIITRATYEDDYSVPAHNIDDGFVAVRVRTYTPFGVDWDWASVAIPMPELAYAYRRFHKALDLISRSTFEFEPSDVDLRFLPVEVLMVLERIAESVIATVLSALRMRDEWRPPGSLLLTCDPRAARIRVRYESFYDKHVYQIDYLCKLHIGDAWLTVTLDKSGEYAVVRVRLDQSNA